MGGVGCCIELDHVLSSPLPSFLSPFLSCIHSLCYGVLWEAEKEKATTEQQPSSTMSTAGLGFAGLGYVVGGGRGGGDESGGKGLKCKKEQEGGGGGGAHCCRGMQISAFWGLLAPLV